MRTKYFSGLLASISVVFLMGLLVVPAATAADLLPPQEAINDASMKLKERLQNPSFTKDFAEITQFVDEVIEPHIDFNRISALVLGKLWRKASKDERKQFKKEFHTLLVRTYSRAFVEFEDWTVRFFPLKMNKDTKKVVVKTEVLQPGIQQYLLAYRAGGHV